VVVDPIRLNLLFFSKKRKREYLVFSEIEVV